MRTGGHWSRPAARRTLDALMRLGGKGTTFQIQEITRSVAVHQDVYSLRCWLQFERGYPERDTELAVCTEHLGLNESGRQVVLYELRPDVMQLHRRLRAGERATAPRAAGSAEPADRPQITQIPQRRGPGEASVVPSVKSAQSADRGPVPAQVALFETDGELARRARYDAKGGGK